MNLPLITSSILALLALMAQGCSQPSTARTIEEAPYQLVEETTLKVRQDLASHLVTTQAKSSTDAAKLEGFGHMSFAPGASYAVRVPFDGYVEQVHVNVGEQVEVGTVLATLRSSEVARLRAEFRRITVALGTERDALKRSERLLAEGAASPREIVESKGRIGALEAELAGVREALSALKVGTSGADVIQLRASRAGDILARYVDPGERVQSSDEEPVFLIGNPTALRIVANFPEYDATLLAQGSQCDFVVPSLGAMQYKGKVTSVVRTIDPQTRTAQVICEPEAPIDPFLRAEMVVRVLVTAEGNETLVVPRSAVLLRRNERVVMVRRGPEEVERRVVTTGLSLGQDIQILSGVRLGEEVVTEGAVLLDGELDQLL